VLDDGQYLMRAAGVGHAPQASPQGLLGKDVGFGGVRSEGHDGGDITHVPALPEHQDGDDASVGAGSLIKLAGELSQLPQVLITDLFLALFKNRDAALLSSLPLNLAFEAGMKVDSASVQLGVHRIGVQAVGDVVGRLGVLGHDEQQCLLAALLPLLFGELPALVSNHQMLLEPVGGVIAGALHQAVAPAYDRDLDYAGVHCFAQRRIADYMLEDMAMIVLGGGGEVELGDYLAAAAVMNGLVDIFYGIIPGAVRVPEVVGLVV